MNITNRRIVSIVFLIVAFSLGLAYAFSAREEDPFAKEERPYVNNPPANQLINLTNETIISQGGFYTIFDGVHLSLGSNAVSVVWGTGSTPFYYGFPPPESVVVQQLEMGTLTLQHGTGAIEVRRSGCHIEIPPDAFEAGGGYIIVGCTATVRPVPARVIKEPVDQSFVVLGKDSKSSPILSEDPLVYFRRHPFFLQRGWNGEISGAEAGRSSTYRTSRLPVEIITNYGVGMITFYPAEIAEGIEKNVSVGPLTVSIQPQLTIDIPTYCGDKFGGNCNIYSNLVNYKINVTVNPIESTPFIVQYDPSGIIR